MAFEVLLRELADDDLPLLYEHQADPGAATMAGFPSRDRASFDAHWAKIRRDPEVLIRTITVDGRVAGNAVCFTMEGRREVGYWIDRAWWGKGVATAALARLLELERTRPLYGALVKTNVASRRLLERNGFSYLEAAGDDLVFVRHD